MPESMAETVGGKIFAYGSYRLGVHNKVALDEFFLSSILWGLMEGFGKLIKSYTSWTEININCFNNNLTRTEVRLGLLIGVFDTIRG